MALRILESLKAASSCDNVHGVGGPLCSLLAVGTGGGGGGTAADILPVMPEQPEGRRAGWWHCYGTWQLCVDPDKVLPQQHYGC